MTTSIRLWLGTFALASGAASAQVATFDAASSLVTIPSVAVGASTFTNVTLRHRGDYVFSLESAAPQSPPGPGYGSYDAVTNVLSLPAVKVGNATYLDVRLQNTGNFTFALQAATPLPDATMQELAAFTANWDALWSTAVPTPGSKRASLFDACFRSDGRTRAYLVDDWDQDADEVAKRDAAQIGRRSGNIQVLAIRNLTNSDGSSRREIDIQWDIDYTDGTRIIGSTNTLISGSSAGTKDCASPQSSPTLRFLGNQRLVAVAVTARNYREERYSISTGAAVSPLVNYRRTVRWDIVDPMGNATYVVVTGPGPAATVNGASTPFSLKFISNRLLAAAPELVGKTGNYLNWRVEDGWRYCRSTASGTPVASIADCVGLGASTYELGVSSTAPSAANDQTFADQGWVAGGIYRFDVYTDDGWKTVNGHAGKTPVATYHETLDVLPYTLVEMAGSGGNDKFPKLKFGSMTSAQVRANLVSATPAPLSVSWNAPLAVSDQSRFVLSSSWEFHQGPKSGNAGSAFNPAYRTINFSYPGSTATANAAWPVTPKLTDQASKTYGEFTVQYSNRNGRLMTSLVAFQ